MDKVFTLPELPPAPVSDLQILVRRLIEYADFSCVRPILDELQALDREGDAASLKVALVWLVKPETRTDYWNDGFKNFCQNCVNVFWWDLFSLEGTLTLAERKRPLVNKEKMVANASLVDVMQTIEKLRMDVTLPSFVANDLKESE